VQGSPQFRRPFCPDCGMETITECPQCKKGIPGRYETQGVLVVGGTTAVPAHCEFCGHPFPWTTRRADKEPACEGAVEFQFNAIALVIHICRRFHTVALQIRKRHDSRGTLDVQDEYDLQDLMHALLRAFFDDVRPEEYVPSYAAKCTRVDFFLKACAGSA